MTKLNATEKKTLAVIAKSGFTFKGDAHFATYRQATVTLNRLERLGLIERQDGESSFALTKAGEDAARFPALPVTMIISFQAAA